VKRKREIRVFVSSTFRDMHAERDELVLRVFPRLRKLCEARHVAFTEVDLRWGVPEEQAAEGEVLPICLAEIESCRPFFIGLLGERYGWVPEEHAPGGDPAGRVFAGVRHGARPAAGTAARDPVGEDSRRGSL